MRCCRPASGRQPPSSTKRYETIGSRPLPLQNRVLPDGQVIASPARGTLMGNRGGAFHTPECELKARHWHSKQWICCLLSFKGRRRVVMQPDRYTELFFLDEATALAAGHRPCFECRRQAALAFASRWNAACGVSGRATAAAMDETLHRERLDAAGGKRTYEARCEALPDNVLVRTGDGFARTTGHRLQSWSITGYGTLVARPSRTVTVLTPASTVAVLAAGYTPRLHSTAL